MNLKKLLIKQVFADPPPPEPGKKIGELEGLPGAYNPDTDLLGTRTLEKILSNVIGFFTIVAGILFIIYFLIGGLNWLTAGGKTDQVEKAKKMLTDATIGLIVVIASYAVIFILGKVLGIDILNPGKYIMNNFWGS